MRNKKLRYLDLEKENGVTFLLLEDKSHKEVLKLRDPQMTEEKSKSR